MLYRSHHPQATADLASAIATLVRKGDVVLLMGDMGSGKTVFAQAFARSLGVDEPVTSPTFTIVNTYSGSRWPVFHADLYRLDRRVEVADLALAELAEQGVLIVEWGEAAFDEVDGHLAVNFDSDPEAETIREIDISAVGQHWLQRVDRLEALVRELS